VVIAPPFNGGSMGKTKRIKTILSALLVIVIAVILILLGQSYFIKWQAEKEFDRLAKEVNTVNEPLNDNAVTGTEASGGTTEADSSDDTGIPKKNLDWAALAEENEDIYAWIYVPGTNIDYPVMQSAVSDDYYLDYNMLGSKGYPGCIYTEQQTSRDFTDFDTVIYGHNMNDDTMFATLHNYEDKSIFLNCPYIYIYTGNKVLVYYIFAAYTGDDAHILNTNDFSTGEGRQKYINEILAYGEESALIRDDAAQEVTTESRILTLSTCVSGKSDERFLVQAVLVGEDEL
jgi:sortase B